MRNVAIHTLDLALLQAGAGVKGEFENRLKGLIEEVKSSPVPIILFIDEAHTMIGAGGAAGQGDAANLLKPALARGELRTIAATTWSEYKKYSRKMLHWLIDPPGSEGRRPSEEQCTVMLRGIALSLEGHHSLRILDQSIHAAVKLSHRLSCRPPTSRQSRKRSGYRVRQARSGTDCDAPCIEDIVRCLDDLAVQKRISRARGRRRS